MFGKKTNTTTNFDDKLKAAKYDCVLQALKDIAKLEVKTADANGYAAAVSAIKTRARLAIDFCGNLYNPDNV